MDKAADVLEPAVNRGKTNIGNLINGLDPLHNHLTDLIGADLSVQRVLNGLLDFCCDPVQLCHFDLALVKSPDHRLQDLIPVKRLAGAIPLDYDDGQTFHCLIGCKSALADKALSPATDTQSIFRMAGINDLAFLVAAKWASHGEISSLS